MNIGRKQILLIGRVKNFLKELENSTVDSSLSSFCYFTPWAETPGYAKLKYWVNGWFYSINFFVMLLKNILGIASHANYIAIGNINPKKNYETLVLSWVFKKNFKEDGSVQDRYFLENSKDLPNSCWILASMDGYVPSNLNDNITVIINKKGFFKYNFFSLFKIIISTIIEHKFSPKKIYHYLYFHSHFAKKVSSIVKKELRKNNYKIFLAPYEAQPFQQNSFLEAKKIDQRILTIGYLHTLLTPNPCDFVHRKGAPDKLLVHGDSQIEMLKTHLDWPKNKLVFTESFRYRVDSNRSLVRKIYTPYTIHNSRIFINEFRNLLKNSPPKYFPVFDMIKIHPPMSWLQEKRHFYLRKKLQEIMELYKDRFSENSVNKNASIFFGVTAAVFEALETGVEAFHICSDPVFDAHTEILWPNLKVKQLSKFTFQYSLTSKGKYIVFGPNEKMLQKTLKKFISY